MRALPRPPPAAAAGPTAHVALRVAGVLALVVGGAGCADAGSPLEGDGAPLEGDGTARAAARHEGASVLLITVDTLRADHLAPYGAPLATPAAARLAREGVVFERAVAHVPLTLPSHCSILTGLYPPGHGVRDNGGFVLGDEQSTLAERFAEAGYETAAFVGSFVLDAQWGLDQGFDAYDDRVDYAGIDRRSLTELERRADAVVDAAIAWLERPRARPFFLWVHVYDPHDPYEPPDGWAQDAPTPYAGEVMFADAQLARLLAALDSTGLRPKTLIVYTSDHGESLGEHGERTHGIFLYGSTLDVPLIIAPPAPSATGGGGRDRDLARLVDVAPTILDLVGLPVPGGIDGRSLLARWNAAAAAPPGSPGDQPVAPVASDPGDPPTGSPGAPGGLVRVPGDPARGPADPARAQGGPARAPDGAAEVAIAEPFSYAESWYPRFHYGWSELTALETRRWKLVRAPRPELYDRAADRAETENVQSRHPRVAAALGAWIDEVTGTVDAAPRPGPIDPSTEARLRSLGYLGGGTAADTAGARQDPKDRLPLLERLQAAERDAADGRLRDAAATLRDLAREDPANPAVHGARVPVELALGRVDDAIAAGRRAVELQPDLAVAVYNLARAYEAAGRLEDAIAGYRRVVGIEPGHLKALLRLAELAYASGDLEQAAGRFEQVVEVAPDLALARRNLGQLALERGDVELGERHLRRAVELGGEGPYLHFNLALIAERRGQVAAAREQYRAEVAAHPGTFEAWINLGILEGREGDLEAAAEAFEGAAAARPESAEGPLRAAEALARLGRTAEALRWAEEAVAREPGNATARQLVDRLRRRRPEQRIGPHETVHRTNRMELPLAGSRGAGRKRAPTGGLERSRHAGDVGSRPRGQGPPGRVGTVTRPIGGDRLTVREER